MSASLALMHAADASPLDRAAAFQELREMVLNSVASEHSKRNYAKALDEVFALCEARQQPLSRALLMEYRAAMLEKKLSASTVNVRLSAMRKLIGEAQRNGIIGVEGFVVLPILAPALLESCGLRLLRDAGDKVGVAGGDALLGKRLGHFGDELQQ
jgi:hypothetical protein